MTGNTLGNTLDSLGITPEKIRAYDQRIPRYTSYPTFPVWSKEFGPEEWRRHLEETSGEQRDLSAYVHIPFCRTHCRFCACNVIITTKQGVADDYLDVVEAEIALMREIHRSRGRVVQLHLGGGTPNYLTHPQMSRLLGLLGSAFPIDEKAERSIEVDPRTATPEDVERLGTEHQYSRISFGVQDFHAETQQAIGRGQTLDITFANVDAARRTGFESVNIDLVYGLPNQTAESWSHTLDQIIQLRPDRIALYNFAYLPGKLAHQRVLEDVELPAPALKLQMFIEAHNRFTAGGWEFIGMDHYALKEDTLATSLRDGTLHRNFMGYTTLRGTDMLAFGVSSISDYQGAFAQNTKKLSAHRRMVTGGELAVECGMVLSEDDLLRRYMIEEIMCNGVLDPQAAPNGWGERVADLIAEERPRLDPLEEDGLIESMDGGFRVTTKGRIFLRNIAVVFDYYMKQLAEKPTFSRAV